LILAAAGVFALLLVVLALHGGSTPTPSANDVAPSTVPSTEAPAPTTTTVDPKAIQAGVANLLAHEGPTPQQVAAVPASNSVHASGHHAKTGASHSHH
jgi:hypothetical protein